jgi:hypothetical protein
VQFESQPGSAILGEGFHVFIFPSMQIQIQYSSFFTNTVPFFVWCCSTALDAEFESN